MDDHPLWFGVCPKRPRVVPLVTWACGCGFLASAVSSEALRLALANHAEWTLRKLLDERAEQLHSAGA